MPTGGISMMSQSRGALARSTGVLINPGTHLIHMMNAESITLSSESRITTVTPLSTE